VFAYINYDENMFVCLKKKRWMRFARTAAAYGGGVQPFGHSDYLFIYYYLTISNVSKFETIPMG
jgi:hypothetical protein